jgi:cleavage and polyadenylation specificity factor subunit 3
MNGNGTLDDADEETERLTKVTYLIMGCVTVRWSNTGEVDLEWEGNLLNDGIADAVLAVLSTVESSPAAVKRTRQFSFIVS